MIPVRALRAASAACVAAVVLGPVSAVADEPSLHPAEPPPRFSHPEIAPEGLHTAAGLELAAGAAQHQVWMTRGAMSLGIAVGAYQWGLRPLAGAAGTGAADAGAFAGASAAILTVGMRYRTSPRSVVFVDASDLRGGAIESGNATVGKVGLELKSARSFMNVAYGGLGMRLAGETGLTLRPSRRGLSLWMRHAF